MHSLRFGLVALALIAAAGGQEAPAAPAATVRMTDRLVFEPATVRIKAGQSITWKNASVVVHTVTADSRLATVPAHVKLPPGVAPFDSGDIDPGGSYSHTFTTPGTYQYICLPHELAGMAGTVIVEP